MDQWVDTHYTEEAIVVPAIQPFRNFETSTRTLIENLERRYEQMLVSPFSNFYDSVGGKVSGSGVTLVFRLGQDRCGVQPKPS